MEPTETDLQSFDDPGFKAAMCRAWGAERCPEALRNRVLALAAGERGRDDLPGRADAGVIGTIPPGRWRQPWLRYGLAAAAMMLLGFGIAYRLDQDRIDAGRIGLGGTEVTFASTVPQSIAKGLLDTHDRCIKYSNHNAYGDLSPDNLSDDNFAVMRRRLEDRLHFPVLAGNIEEALGRNGWKFKGAAVCEVAGVDAAHLVFTRTGQAISIFSLPPSSVRHSGEPHEIEDSNPDHPTAVFVWSDGVHCVVGSSDDRSLSVDQVRSVLDHLRPHAPGAAAH